MPRQYVACKFSMSHTKTYTYHNDGDPVEVGDIVRVDNSRGGEGEHKSVWVAAILDTAPSFPTGAIHGRAGGVVTG